MVISVIWKLVSYATDVVGVVLGGGAIGDSGPNISRFGGCFHLNRVNREQELLLVNILNINLDVIDLISDVILNYDINHSLDVIIYGVQSVCDYINEALKDIMDSLNKFGGQVEGVYLRICRV